MTRRVGSSVPSFLWLPVRELSRRLYVRANVTYGKDFRLGRASIVSAPHGLVIGNAVSIGPRSIVQVNGSIGDFALIGMGVQIVGRNDHLISEEGTPISDSTWVGERNATERDAVSIGRDVWIGGASVVLSGVTIGQGAIVGAGSVVTSDVPDFSIAVGNPARVVRKRFDSEEMERCHSERLDDLIRCRYTDT